MSARFRRVKGTRDLLPPETDVWVAVEETARRVFGLYGYREIRTPLLEATELFERSVGESTDIVGKEMYSFTDRKGRRITLRPESTASVARAYVENGLHNEPQPVKLFYIGPQFRYERPQKGRYRQFHQIGAELLGDPSPDADVEVLLMLVRFLREMRFEELTVLVNTVGDETSRRAYRDALTAFLEPLRDQLSEDGRRQLAQNPLRILDSKNPHERELLRGAPCLTDHLSREAGEHFESVRSSLKRYGVPFRVEERLVRGLDYYSHTVFEILSEALGAQDAIVGGGRYDGLVHDLGGPEVPGVGFAMGEDRLVDVLPVSFRARATTTVPALVVAVDLADAEPVVTLCEDLRSAGVACEAELRRSLKGALKRADRAGVETVCLIGEGELERGVVAVKDLTAGTQLEVSRDRLAEHLAKRLARVDR